jgi:hypothetical protein
LKDLEGFQPENKDPKTLIGIGAFSQCYRASLYGTPVAVKVLTIENIEKQKSDMEYEVGIMW